MEKEEAIQVREKADTGRQRKKPPVTKRRYSPCEPSPPPSKKTKKDREVRCGGERRICRICRAERIPTVAVSNASLREEYEPRRLVNRVMGDEYEIVVRNENHI
ncbi:hypothetical protein PC128_g4305 [Phytophthora cactorum]|nr:hypothetical protein PC128_g4305 [Phytophthora cactorum]